MSALACWLIFPPYAPVSRMWRDVFEHGDEAVKPPAKMATLSKHAKVRSADRSIKSEYVDECMRKGKRTNEDDTRYKYYYEGLCVIATRGSAVATQEVVTAYWTYNNDPQAYEALRAKAGRQKTKHQKEREKEKYNGAQGKRYDTSAAKKDALTDNEKLAAVARMSINASHLKEAMKNGKLSKKEAMEINFKMI
jgi:hypothetical protein